MSRLALGRFKHAPDFTVRGMPHCCAGCLMSVMAFVGLMIFSAVWLVVQLCPRCVVSVVAVVATYCVIASLVLLRRLRSVLTVTDIQLVGDWCISQLGRDPRLDCCSAFCIMAVLTVSMLTHQAK